jgi:DNA-cytosine methyltransferase
MSFHGLGIREHCQARVSNGCRRGRVITLGSSCSGWLVESLACERLKVPHQQLFACDSDRHVKQFCQRNFKVQTWVDDVFAAAHKALPTTDVYVAGFPCQPYSSAGRNAGRADSRAHVIGPIIKHIAQKVPTVFVLENVVNIVSKSHVEALAAMLRRLKTSCTVGGGRPRYVLYGGVLNSRFHGVPQQRRRLFLIGLRTDKLVRGWCWPKRVRQPQLSSAYDRRAGGAFARQPAAFGWPVQKHANRNLRRAYALLREHGIADPSSQHFVVDLDCSPGRAGNMMCDWCPTITATRAGRRGFWSTYLRRRLSIQELMRLQGACPTRLEQCISDRPR